MNTPRGHFTCHLYEALDMADFSDDEDRLLIQLTLQQSQMLMGKFDWHQIHLHMQHTAKSKEQLRQRLRTLKRRFGQNLSRLPVRLRKTPSLTLPTTPLYSHLAQNAIVQIFGSIDSRDVHQHSGKSHLNVGEISPESITSMIQALPILGPSDTFVDMGSGVGNVVVQIALETSVGKSIGVEIRAELVAMSNSCIQRALHTYPALQKVWQKVDDISQPSLSTQLNLKQATVWYSNCELFYPSALQKMIQFVTATPSMRYLALNISICPRHRQKCRNKFCSTFQLVKTLSTMLDLDPKDNLNLG